MEVPTPATGLAKFRHVANTVRDAIRAGEFPPGGLIPSTYDLARVFGYDLATVRRGLDVLDREGLIEAQHGRGTFVRQARLVTRDVAAGLRREYAAIDTGIPDDPGVFRTLTGVDGDVQVATSYTRAAATPDLAEVFGAAANAGVLCRRYAYRVDGRPHQLVWSYLPLSLVDGTTAADPGNERPGRGVMQVLAEIGVRVDPHATVRLRVRIATPEECADLEIPEGLPVFTSRRLLHAGGRVVEVADSVVPGDRVEFVMNINLNGDGS